MPALKKKNKKLTISVDSLIEPIVISSLDGKLIDQIKRTIKGLKPNATKIVHIGLFAYSVNASPS